MTSNQVIVKYPMSFSQRSLWYLHNYYDVGTTYTISSALTIKGRLNLDILKQSISDVVHRHEMLRTTFTAEGELPIQIISGYNRFDFEQTFVGAISPAKLHDIITNFNSKAFDLINGPLLRFNLILQSEFHYTLQIAMHHIIADGWSLGILIKEITQYYTCYVTGELAQLPQLQIQYVDYSEWQHDLFNTEKKNRLLTYWRECLKDLPQPLFLPADFERPKIQSHNGGTVVFTFDAELTKKINALCQANGLTTYMVLICAYAIWLSRYSGNDDILIGTPVANRGRKEVENLIGYFVNTLVVRIKVDSSASFSELLNTTREITTGAFSHQDLPFELLVEELDYQHDSSYSPFFQVFFALQNAPMYAIELPDLKITQLEYETKTSKFDLSLYIEETNGELRHKWEYCADLFSKQTVKKMAAGFEILLTEAINSPLEAVLSYSMVGNEEKKLLHTFNNTALEYDKSLTVVDYFEKQVLQNPGKTALLHNYSSLSFNELNNLSNQFAHYLRQVHSIGPDELVGVKLERTQNLIVVLLGILKAGGAYVPIDPAYPPERITYLLEDSKCKLLIDETELMLFAAKQNHYSTNNPTKIHSPLNLAYIIYTSGSTGKPKGVMIEHGNLNSFICWCNKEFEQSNFETAFAVTSICFDLSVFELFYTLCAGKKIRLLTNALSVTDYLNNSGKILLNTVPSVLATLLEEGSNLSQVSVLNIAGEPVSPNLVAKLDTDLTEVRNLYGPSEDTTYSTVYRLTKNKPVLIGKPIGNTQIYILNEALALAPVGVKGELYIAGDGVARGYLNRPELSADKFQVNPFHEGGRLYKTGDIGKWLPDGNIEFTGRNDNQVKIRGFRIELGEIENVIMQYPEGIKQVVVEVKNNGSEKALVAFLIADKELNKSDLQHFLRQKLPAYMIPAFFIPLNKLPLTSTGKINRKALPELAPVDALKREYLAAESNTEKKLLKIWATVLGKESISIKDNFFELGGHSLKAIRLLSRINREMELKLNLKDIFLMPSIQQQAQLINSLAKTESTSIKPAPVQSGYPLSSSQRRLWILSQFDESSVAYNMPGAHSIDGNINLEALKQSFNMLIQRHESLRTVFKIKHGKRLEIEQHILPTETIEFKLKYTDLRKLPSKEAELKKQIQRGLYSPFNLEKGPLLRASLYQLEDSRSVFFYVMHHIISDGWSMNVFLKELLYLYNALINNKEIELRPLLIQYKDYAVWQQSQLSGNTYVPQRNYWLKQFEGELPVLSLQTDKPRPPFKTYNGDTVSTNIDLKTSQKIKTFCNEHGGTLFMGLLATVNTLLYHYTGQTDIVTGSPIAGREQHELENQLGFYVNTLALRSRFNAGESFTSLLGIVKELTLEAYENQAYPFDELVNYLQPERDMSRNALFDVMLIVNENETHKIHGLKNIQLSSYTGLQNKVSKFDLTFTFTVHNTGLSLDLEYNSDLFVKETIKRVINHFENLLHSILAQPEIPLCSLNYMSIAEKQALLTTFNNTNTTHTPEFKNLAALFEEQVTKTPGNTAVIYEHISLTYTELNAKANQLARYLQQEYNIQANDLVGIKLHRSEWLIASILGTLKAGGAYLPIDPTYPKERVDYILADSRCKVTLDDEELLKFQSVQAQHSTHNPASLTTMQDLAYVIYTSGTTGLPKGAMINQHSFVNLIQWYNKLLKLKHEDCVVLFAPVSFDLAQKNIFSPLTTGSKVCLPAHFYGDYTAFAKTIAKNRVSIINCAPSAFYPLLDPEVNEDFTRLSSLRKVVLGGESIQTDEFFNWLNSGKYKAEVINSYGPTECTDVVLSYTINNADWLKLKTIPIGLPIDNTVVHILNKHLNLVPVGICGDLYISGISVGKGYLNNPDLTADKFITNPFKPGEMMYKTGDLGKRLPDGNIDFLGREDNQIKIRGLRVELGEIENSLLQLNEIKKCKVIANTVEGNSEKTLVAYLVMQTPLEAARIHAALKAKLPDYMIPEYYFQLLEFPLTSSGKVDLNALPEPTSANAVKKDLVMPRNSTETALIQIWEDILNKKQLGIEDSFFDLGGHSLKITELIYEINTKLGVQLKYPEVFANPILKNLAAVISEKPEKAPERALYKLSKAPASDWYKANINQKRLWQFYQLNNKDVSFNMLFSTVINSTITPLQIEEILRIIFRKHEMFRARFVEKEGTLFFSIDDNYRFNNNLQDFTTFNEQEKQSGRNELVEKMVSVPFNLNEFPLFRTAVIKLNHNIFELVLVVHHIIFDGKSVEIIYNEFNTLHQTILNAGNLEQVKQELPIQYKDFTHWLHNFITDEKASAEMKQYWHKKLSGFDRSKGLKYDFEPPVKIIKDCHIFITYLNSQLKQSIDNYTALKNISHFNFLLACYYCAIAKHSYKDDLIIGSPGISRPFAELDRVTGFFANSLIFRIQSAPSMTFSELLTHIQADISETLERQYYPLENVCDTISVTWPELLKVWFNLSIFDFPVTQHQETTQDIYTDKIHNHTVDIATYINIFDDRLELKTYYSIHAFKKEKITRLINDFKSVINLAIRNDNITISKL